jgi:hypothetical protein
VWAFLAAVSRGYALLQGTSFSLWWLLLLQSTGSRQMGSVTAACRLWSTGLEVVAQWHSFLMGMWDLSRAGMEPVSPALARQMLNHWTTREAPRSRFKKILFILLWLC